MARYKIEELDRALSLRQDEIRQRKSKNTSSRRTYGLYVAWYYYIVLNKRLCPVQPPVSDGLTSAGLPALGNQSHLLFGAKCQQTCRGTASAIFEPLPHTGRYLSNRAICASGYAMLVRDAVGTGSRPHKLKFIELSQIY